MQCRSFGPAVGRLHQVCGYAEKWDAVDIDGSLDAKDCAITYKLAGRTLAVATISRDLQNLQVEAAVEADGYAGTSRCASS
jgi:hypothetical protein